MYVIIHTSPISDGAGGRLARNVAASQRGMAGLGMKWPRRQAEIPYTLPLFLGVRGKRGLPPASLPSATSFPAVPRSRHHMWQRRGQLQLRLLCTRLFGGWTSGCMDEAGVSRYLHSASNSVCWPVPTYIPAQFCPRPRGLEKAPQAPSTETLWEKTPRRVATVRRLNHW